MSICMPVVALALTMAACGGDDKPAPPMSDEEEIVAAVNGFFAALVDDDGELACSYLTEHGQRLMRTVARRQFLTEIGEGADCEAVIAVSSEQLADEEARASTSEFRGDF